MKDWQKEAIFGGVAAAFVAATVVLSMLGAPPVQPVGPVYTLPTSQSTSPATLPSTEQQAALLNINTADKAALMQLDGIGETLAARIIAYRESHGGFLTVEELLQVEGIGEKRLAAIRELVTVK